jgi:dynein heavy chain 2
MLPGFENIASKLRSQIAELAGSSQSIQGHFQQYLDLMQQPTIASALVSERELLLSQLKEEVGQVRQVFTSLLSGETSELKGNNVPVIVATLTRCRQLSGRALEAISVCDDLLKDLPGAAELSETGAELLKEMHGFEAEQFEDWCRDTSNDLADEDIMLQTTGRLMHFDHGNGQLMVHYSDRLMGLMREVRQLSALGYTAPAPIVQAASTAKKFYRQAVILKQVRSIRCLLLSGTC